MTLPAADHPIWKIIRLAVVGIVMTVMCATLYRNGYDAKDTILIVTTLLGLAGFDETKRQLTKETDK